jgi:hypothetical protein
VGEPSLKDRVRADMTRAMKTGDALRVSALRMFLAAIANREVEGSERRQLTDDEVRELAAKEVKKRTESIEAFEAAGRDELAERERAERDVVAAYAPEPLSEEAVDALVEEAIDATGATSAKEMGKVMGYAMGKARGRVDGNVLKEKVLARLSA